MFRFMLAIIAVLACFPNSVSAHKSNIGLLDIRSQTLPEAEGTAYGYTLNWSFTGVSMQAFPTPVVPPQCQQSAATRTSHSSSGVAELYTLQCGASLVGHEFEFNGERDNIDQLVLLFDDGERQIDKFYTGKQLRPVINADDLVPAVVGATSTQSTVSANFFWVGFEHMILGWDHLLFLICLLMLTGINRRIIVTVTGFTLGHSVTLLLASKDVISLPVTPVEILIALSIAYMAAEVWRGRHGHVSLFARYPMMIATGFGLLHGMGFSSALDQLAFSEDMSLAALLLFNLGIEAAQLLVVAVASLLVWLLSVPATSRFAMPMARASYAMSYGIGITAGYWFVERTLSML